MLVEAALITPVVAALLFGIIEFGLLLRTSLTASSASREGARVAAANPGSDQFAARVYDRVKDSLTAVNRSDVQRIVIYEADPATGLPLTGAGQNTFVTADGNSGFLALGTDPDTCSYHCLVYTPDSQDWLDPQDGGSALYVGPDFGAVNGTWDPATMNACPPPAVGADPRTRVGVFIQLRYNPLTPLIGRFIGSRPVMDRTTIRIEPKTDTTGC